MGISGLVHSHAHALMHTHSCNPLEGGEGNIFLKSENLFLNRAITIFALEPDVEPEVGQHGQNEA